MKQYFKADYIANAIRMKYKKDTAVIIVEGGYDKKVYKLFFNNKAVFETSSGKDIALEALEIICKGKDSHRYRVLAIVDADFDYFKKIKNTVNKFITDTHDIETMIFKSQAFDKYLEGIENKSQCGIKRENILKEALKIAVFRFMSDKDNLGINFKNLDFSQFYCISDNSIDINKLRQFLNIENEKIDIDISYFKDNEYKACNGKDVIEILYIQLYNNYPPINKDDIKVDLHKISDSLADKYDIFCFKQTKLYENLKKWETEKLGYKILQD